MKKKISIVTPTYNEDKNIEKLILVIKQIMTSFQSKYDYEHIVIDNNSNDNTIDILKELAKEDKNLKVIINSRNFGHIRSPFYGLLQAKGDAVIFFNSDFQDPPQLIEEYISNWEKGHKVTLAQKNKTKEPFIMKHLKKFYYKVLNASSSVNLPINTTGSGIYDKKIIEQLRKIKDPYPYLRGLVAEIEGDINFIQFDQPERLKGVTKSNFFTYYDYVLLGFIKHSSMPLRFVIFFGFISSLLSFFSAIVYLIYKIIFWDSFEVGIGPLVIGMFLFFSIITFTIGLIGEYILSLLTYSRNLPLVIEKERINFD